MVMLLSNMAPAWLIRMQLIRSGMACQHISVANIGWEGSDSGAGVAVFVSQADVRYIHKVLLAEVSLLPLTS